MVDRGEQLPLEVAKRVLMRVPAAKVDLHHPDSRFHQATGNEEALPPFFSAIQFASGVGFKRQVERILLSRQRGEEQALSLMTVSAPGFRRREDMVRIRLSLQLFELGEQFRAAGELRDEHPLHGTQIGEM